jgi:hypothetical protein
LPARPDTQINVVVTTAAKTVVETSPVIAPHSMYRMNSMT